MALRYGTLNPALRLEHYAGTRPAVTDQQDTQTQQNLALFGPRTLEHINVLTDPLRSRDIMTMADTYRDISAYLGKMIEMHEENQNDWLQVLYPRGESANINYTWEYLEIGQHVMLP